MCAPVHVAPGRSTKAMCATLQEEARDAHEPADVQRERSATADGHVPSGESGRSSGSLEGEELWLERAIVGGMAKRTLARFREGNARLRGEVGNECLRSAGRTGRRIVPVLMSVISIDGAVRPARFQHRGDRRRQGRRLASIGQRSDDHQALGEHRDRRHTVAEGGRDGAKPEPGTGHHRGKAITGALELPPARSQKPATAALTGASRYWLGCRRAGPLADRASP